MVKLVLFPYRKCTLISNLDNLAIAKRMKSFVDLYGSRGFISDKYYGTINEKNFSVYKSSYFFNATVLKIYGQIKEDDDGKSTIHIKFMLAENLFVFSALLFLILLILFILTLIHTPDFWLKFVPLLFIIILYLFVSIPFHIIAEDANLFITKMLDAKKKERVISNSLAVNVPVQ